MIYLVWFSFVRFGRDSVIVHFVIQDFVSLITCGNHCIVCLHCMILYICCQQGHHRFPLGNSSPLGDSAFSRSPQSSRFCHFSFSHIRGFSNFLIFSLFLQGFLIFSPIFKVFSFSPQSSRFHHFLISPQYSRFYHFLPNIQGFIIFSFLIFSPIFKVFSFLIFRFLPKLQGFISADWRIKKWKCQHFRELGTQQQWWHVGWMSITSLSSPGDSTTFGLHYKQVKNHRFDDHFCPYFWYADLPWRTCENDWNTPSCRSPYEHKVIRAQGELITLENFLGHMYWILKQDRYMFGCDLKNSQYMVCHYIIFIKAAKD